MQKIRVALASFGMSGKVFHAPFVHAHPGFELVAVTERSLKSAHLVYPGVRSYPDFDEMLSDTSIDLVVVNTPNATHFDFAQQALLADKHVIVEKPFTVDVLAAIALDRLASAKGKLLSVYHNRRWDSDFQTVRSVVNSGILGDIREVEIHFDRFKEQLSPKVHKETPGPGTGALFDLGAHLVDQALQLFGWPEAVFADIAIMRPFSLVDDYFELLLYYPDKRVRLKGTYVALESVPAFIIHGSKGSFLKTRADVQEADLQAGKSLMDADWGIEPEAHRGILHTGENDSFTRKTIETLRGNYMAYYEGIYDAIINHNNPPVTAEEGKQVIQLINAAIQSSHEKKVVAL